jgi:hypothetical protein
MFFAVDSINCPSATARSILGLSWSAFSAIGAELFRHVPALQAFVLNDLLVYGRKSMREPEGVLRRINTARR